MISERWEATESKALSRPCSPESTGPLNTRFETIMKPRILLVCSATVFPISGCYTGAPALTDEGPSTLDATTSRETGSESGGTTSGGVGQYTGSVGSGETGVGDAESTSVDTGSGSTAAGEPPAGPRVCVRECETVSDCSTPGLEEECIDGICVFTFVCDEMNCPIEAGFECVDIDGEVQCVELCPEGDECSNPLECIGETPDGKPYCAREGEPQPCAEGEPCKDGLGLCNEGVCVCSSDDDCDVDGYTCPE